MENCIVTKLVQEVPNNKLPKLGKITLDIVFRDSNDAQLYLSSTEGDIVITADSNALYLDSDEPASSVTITGGAIKLLKIKPTATKIEISNKYKIYLMAFGTNNFYFTNGYSFIEYMTSLTRFQLRDDSEEIFDLAKVPNKENLLDFALLQLSGGLTGNLMDFSVSKGLYNLDLRMEFNGCTIEEFATAMASIRDSDRTLALNIPQAGATYQGNVIHSCTISFSGGSYTVSDIS